MTRRGAGGRATSPGDASSSTLFDERPLALEAGGRLDGGRRRVRDVGDARRRRVRTRCSSLHALTGDSHAAGPAGPGHPQPGWWDPLIGPGAARSTPTGSSWCAPTCSAAARARPGPRRSPPTAARTDPRFPIDHDPRPGRGRGRARRPARDRPLARRRRRLDGRHAGRSSGPSGIPDRVRARGGHLASARRRPRSRSPVRGADPRHPRRPELRADGDYYDAPDDGPDVGPVVRARHRPDQLPVRARVRRSGSDRDQQGDEDPLAGGRYAVESYLEYHGEKLVAPLRRQHLHRAERGDEPPRRRPRPGRRRRGAGAHRRPR